MFENASHPKWQVVACLVGSSLRSHSRIIYIDPIWTLGGLDADHVEGR